MGTIDEKNKQSKARSRKAVRADASSQQVHWLFTHPADGEAESKSVTSIQRRITGNSNSSFARYILVQQAKYFISQSL